MEWTEHFTNLLDTGPGQFIFGMLVLILGPTALLSERVVKERFGAVGALFRWIKRRRAERQEIEEQISERQVQDLRAEIARVDKARKQSTDALSKQVTRLEIRTEQQHSYIIWFTDKWRVLELWAAEHGHILPPPPFMTFTEWKEREEERSESD